MLPHEIAAFVCIIANGMALRHPICYNSRFFCHHNLCPHSVQKAQSGSLEVPQDGQIFSEAVSGACSAEGDGTCSSASCASGSAAGATGTVSRNIGFPHAVQKRVPCGIIAPQLAHFSRFCVFDDAVLLGVGAPQ